MLLLYIVSFKEFGSLVCLWHDVKLRKTQLEVRSLTATWSRDLWGHRVVVFLEMCQIVGWTAMANLAALRAAVFSLSATNLRGGVEINPPPPVRGLSCILPICIPLPAEVFVLPHRMRVAARCTPIAPRSYSWTSFPELVPRSQRYRSAQIDPASHSATIELLIDTLLTLADYV